MARPKASEGRNTRQEIVDAALELFAERGFFGTSLRDIARAVGVRESALYHHFPNKQALFAAVAVEPNDELRRRLSDPRSDPTPDDLGPVFESLVGSLLERFATLRERKLFRILASDGLRLAAAGEVGLVARVIPVTELLAFLGRLVQEKRLVGEADLLAVELLAPILLWRALQVVAPSHRFVTEYRSFAKRHVAHFLRSASNDRPAGGRHKVNGRSISRRRP